MFYMMLYKMLVLLTEIHLILNYHFYNYLSSALS